MKQKKAKTNYTPDLCFAFVFITNRLDPLEKPFYKLGLRVSSGFPKHSNTIKALDRCLVLSSVSSCLETLMKQSPSSMEHKLCLINDVDESNQLLY